MSLKENEHHFNCPAGASSSGRSPRRCRSCNMNHAEDMQCDPHRSDSVSCATVVFPDPDPPYHHQWGVMAHIDYSKQNDSGRFGVCLPVMDIYIPWPFL